MRDYPHLAIEYASAEHEVDEDKELIERRRFPEVQRGSKIGACRLTSASSGLFFCFSHGPRPHDRRVGHRARLHRPQAHQRRGRFACSPTACTGGPLSPSSSPTGGGTSTVCGASSRPRRRHLLPRDAAAGRGVTAL